VLSRNGTQLTAALIEWAYRVLHGGAAFLVVILLRKILIPDSFRGDDSFASLREDLHSTGLLRVFEEVKTL
jgi:hypothetical protein